MSDISRRLLMMAIWGTPLVLAGCDASERAGRDPVVITPVVPGPHVMLLSEVLAADDRGAFVPADFTITNTTDQSQQVELVSKSCTCYGMLLDGEPLEVKSPFTLSPHAVHTLAMDVSAPATPTERVWRSTLHAGAGDGDRDEAGIELPITLTARVVDDARLEPEVVTVTAAAGGDETTGAGEPQRIHLNAIHVWRGRSADVIPQLNGWLDQSLLKILNPDASADEIGPDLWQRTWELAINVPAAQLAEGGLRSIELVFSGENKTVATARGRLLIESRKGIVVPEVVHLGQVPIGDARRRRIVLAADDGRSFRITGWAEGDSANATDENFLVAYERDKTDLRHLVEIEWTANEVGAAEQQLVLQTDHPLRPEISIDVRANVIASPSPAETK